MSQRSQHREPWVPADDRARPVTTLSDTTVVQGTVSEGWEAVAHEFIANFQRGEVGASCTVVARGKRVVDLWGGHRAPGADGWSADTLSVFFSCSKILTALVIHRLIAEGQVQPDTPLSKIWPELAAARGGATLRMAMSHTLGLPALDRKLKAGAYNDHDYMVEQLSRQEPLWEPGTRVGYHPITFGFILGEVVRRLTGKTLGRYFAEHFAEPLGLDLYIGLPAEAFPRVAPTQPHALQRSDPLKHVARASQQIGSIQNLWLFNSGAWRTEEINSVEGLQSEIPAASGVGNARALASLLAIFNDQDAMRKVGLNDDAVAMMESVSAASHRDATLLCKSRFSLGLMKSIDNREDAGADSFVIGRQAFGHVGMGGSFGLCDREAGFSAAYVMNQQGHGILLNERGQSLVDAMYQSAGFRQIRAGEWCP